MSTQTKSKFQGKADSAAATETAAVAPRSDSKIGKVVALLQRKDGATLEEMTKSTGWQAHSARAALTGLKKKGYEITKSKRDTVTCYSIAATS